MFKKKLIIAGAAFIAVTIIGVGAFAALHFFASSKPAVAAIAAAPPPKPIYFTDVSDITVSIATAPGSPPSSFVQVGIQFSTYNQAAIAGYAQLQPIIKADIINLLMTQTSASLGDSTTRENFLKSCLDVANQVLSKNTDIKNGTAFSNAYITNLVFQE